jgi:hypothetical protein
VAKPVTPRTKFLATLVIALAILDLGALSDAPAAAQPSVPPPAPPAAESVVLRGLKFVGGAAVGLVAHEGGHLLFDTIFDASPSVKKVSFGPIPFFAVTHSDVSPRQEFVISSAGFWVQEGVDEILLTTRPGLRRERAPFTKGVLAFNVLASVGYAGAAFAHAGPAERDTRSMAVSLGVDEAWIGVLILAPAVLDAYRYFHPEARWAAWASRSVKIGSVLLVLK